MRESAIWIGLIFLFLVLLFSGLNIAENGVTGIMGLSFRQKAFSICHDPGKGFGFTLNFAGWKSYFYVNNILDFIDQRWGG